MVPGFLFRFQAFHCSSSSATTLANIPECDVPQYSVQKTWCLPGTVAVNQMLLYIPGTTSCLILKFGMKNPWRTSSDVIMSFTGLLIGTKTSPTVVLPLSY